MKNILFKSLTILALGAGMLANVLLNKKTLNLPAKAAMKTLGLDPKNIKTDSIIITMVFLFRADNLLI
jgi:hypothetical protein